MSATEALASIPGLGRLPEDLLVVLGWVGLALLVGTVVRLGGYAVGRREERALIRSLESWWVLAVVFTLALLAGRPGIVLLTVGLGLLGLDEYLRLAGCARSIRAAGAIGALAVHGWVLLDWPSYFWVGFPAAAAGVALFGSLVGLRRLWSSAAWGMLGCGLGLAHVQGLFDVTSVESEAPAGALGLVVFVVLTTEVNDIAQALWGRRFGRRQLAPEVSPRKTWEGLVGGVATAVLVGVAIGPRLLPSPGTPPGEAAGGAAIVWFGLTAALVALAGITGDLAMSVVKRHASVRDSGTLLPGQGGALDRIDSLTLSAPFFAYWLALGWR